MATKHCSRCDTTKTTRGWPRMASKPDGLHPWCRACKNTYQRQRRLDPKHLEAARAYDRKRRREDPARRAYKHAHDRLRHLRALDNGPVERVSANDVIKRDGPTCCLCQQPLAGDATLEHLTPISRGGTHTADNLGVAHKGCNSRKGTLTLAEWRARTGSLGLLKP